MHLVPTLCWVMKARHTAALKDLPVQLEMWASPWPTSHSVKGAKTKYCGTEDREKLILVVDMEV